MGRSQYYLKHLRTSHISAYFEIPARPLHQKPRLDQRARSQSFSPSSSSSFCSPHSKSSPLVLPYFQDVSEIKCTSATQGRAGRKSPHTHRASRDSHWEVHKKLPPSFAIAVVVAPFLHYKHTHCCRLLLPSFLHSFSLSLRASKKHPPPELFGSNLVYTGNFALSVYVCFPACECVCLMA